MSNVSTDTWVRTIVLIAALLNQVLTALGKKPLPVSDDEIYTIISSVVTVAVSVWAWWKNNSFTGHAITADGVLTGLKSGTNEPDGSSEGDDGTNEGGERGI